MKDETTLTIPLPRETRRRIVTHVIDFAVTFVAAMFGVLAAIATVYLAGWWR